jgi:hypothetical protein
MEPHNYKINPQEGSINKELAENPIFQELAETFDRLPGDRQSLLIESLKILGEFSDVEKDSE